MHTHFWKLNAFLNPEMLGLGQKGQFPLHASLLFISLEAEHLGREPDAVSEGRPGGSTVMHPSATENLNMGKSSLPFIQVTATVCSGVIWAFLYTRNFLCVVPAFSHGRPDHFQSDCTVL